MAGFRTDSFTIHQHGADPLRVDGVTLTHWGVHGERGNWTVSHLGTGKRALGFARKDDALAFARTLQDITGTHGDLPPEGPRSGRVEPERSLMDAIVNEYKRLSGNRSMYRSQAVWY